MSNAAWRAGRARIRTLGALGSVVALLVAGCGGGSSGGNASPESTRDNIKVVLQVEPNSMDPCDSHLAQNGPILVDNITEPLVHLDVSKNTVLGQFHQDRRVVARRLALYAPRGRSRRA